MFFSNVRAVIRSSAIKIDFRTGLCRRCYRGRNAPFDFTADLIKSCTFTIGTVLPVPGTVCPCQVAYP